MEIPRDSAGRTTPLGRLIWWILLAAALFSLYLVLHPFTPLSRLDLSILDQVQLRRATHVLLLLVAGYLITSQLQAARPTIGAWVFALLSLPFLYTFWVPNVPGVDIPLAGKLMGTLAWACYPAYGATPISPRLCWPSRPGPTRCATTRSWSTGR